MGSGARVEDPNEDGADGAPAVAGILRVKEDGVPAVRQTSGIEHAFNELRRRIKGSVNSEHGVGGRPGLPGGRVDEELRRGDGLSRFTPVGIVESGVVGGRLKGHRVARRDHRRRRSGVRHRWAGRCQVWRAHDLGGVDQRREIVGQNGRFEVRAVLEEPVAELEETRRYAQVAIGEVDRGAVGGVETDGLVGLVPVEERELAAEGLQRGPVAGRRAGEAPRPEHELRVGVDIDVHPCRVGRGSGADRGISLVGEYRSGVVLDRLHLGLRCRGGTPVGVVTLVPARTAATTPLELEVTVEVRATAG